MVCQKCQSEFPIRILIDNKWRNLCNRKFCLDCQPFRSGRIDLPKNKKKKYCTICNKERFIKGKHCSACASKFRRITQKIRAIKYKGGSCSICGYDKCIAALTFHHIDPSAKEFAIAEIGNSKWEKIKTELDKCILVCSNCHAELHNSSEIFGALVKQVLTSV